MFEVTKDTIISDVMMNAPNTMQMFQDIGMHCMAARSPPARRSMRPARSTVSTPTHF
jgi:hypothetical protein